MQERQIQCRILTIYHADVTHVVPICGAVLPYTETGPKGAFPPAINCFRFKCLWPAGVPPKPDETSRFRRTNSSISRSKRCSKAQIRAGKSFFSGYLALHGSLHSKRRISTGRGRAAARAGSKVAPTEIAMATTAIHR